MDAVRPLFSKSKIGPLAFISPTSWDKSNGLFRTVQASVLLHPNPVRPKVRPGLPDGVPLHQMDVGGLRVRSQCCGELRDLQLLQVGFQENVVQSDTCRDTKVQIWSSPLHIDKLWSFAHQSDTDEGGGGEVTLREDESF